MTKFLEMMLVVHVLSGLVGVSSVYFIWTGFLKKTLKLSSLIKSCWIALVSFVLSWLSGGYYYVAYYGDNIKPVIKSGDYPWAHSVFTETKEHLFLFLPFLTLMILISLYLYGDKLEKNEKLKKSFTLLSGITFFLGVFITLAGVIISGANR